MGRQSRWAEQLSAPAALRFPARASGRGGRLRAGAGRAVAVCLVLCWAGSAVSNDDPGFELVLDRARNLLSARDVRSGEQGPVLRVAVGSPGHPTPSGRFRLGRVIFRPAWRPGEFALDAGARAQGASLRSPMGVAKLPFAENGRIALHGGGDPDVLGKPVSSGCVRATDADLLRLIAWLELRDGLAPPRLEASGEVVRDLGRMARLHVY